MGILSAAGSLMAGAVKQLATSSIRIVVRYSVKSRFDKVEEDVLRNLEKQRAPKAGQVNREKTIRSKRR